MADRSYQTALTTVVSNDEVVENHQRFEALHGQLFACLDELRKVRLIDSQTLAFKLSQLDDTQSTHATLRQTIDQQHAELSRLRNDCIRFETENAGLQRDVQTLKAEARERQNKQLDEISSLESMLSTKDSDTRQVQRKLTDLKFDFEDVKMQLTDSQAEVAQLRIELKGYEQEVASTSMQSSQVKLEADGEIRQLRKEKQALLSKVEALEHRIQSQSQEAERTQQQMRDLRVADAKKDEILHAREDTIVSLERQNAQLASAVETNAVDLESAQNKILDLESQLKSLKTEYVACVSILLLATD